MQKLISIVNGVTRHPGKRMAEPVTLDILAGEQVAIVGPNASGKSRLVDILISRYPLLLNEVHYDFSPSAHRLVSDNIRYISFRDGYGDADATYYYQQRWNQHDIDESSPTVSDVLQQCAGDEALRSRLYQLFQLEPLLDKHVIALSSGELRKLQLTRALLGAPRLLVLDNPFIGLDAETRTLLRDLLQTLIDELGLSIILVLSRNSDIPDFITHVIPVRPGCQVLPKQSLEDYRRGEYGQEAGYGLSAEKRQWLLSLPAKDFSKTPFYPCGGEMLRFDDVSIRYGQRTILDHLNWTVREGECWALGGPNGSGKSTLLSLVCADNPQGYACNIHLFGHRRGSGESIWDIKRHIGYVSPEMHRAYLRDLPALDIVASGLADSVGLYTRPRADQRANCMDWMRLFGIDALAERTFLQLSSGEQRLCLLARAFVKDPELLILDEPLHGLDAANRKLVGDVVNAFCERPHKTLVMVSHYSEELPSCVVHRLMLNRQYPSMSPET